MKQANVPAVIAGEAKQSKHSDIYNAWFVVLGWTSPTTLGYCWGRAGGRCPPYGEAI